MRSEIWSIMDGTFTIKFWLQNTWNVEYFYGAFLSALQLHKFHYTFSIYWQKLENSLSVSFCVLWIKISYMSNMSESLSKWWAVQWNVNRLRSSYRTKELIWDKKIYFKHVDMNVHVNIVIYLHLKYSEHQLSSAVNRVIWDLVPHLTWKYAS